MSDKGFSLSSKDQCANSEKGFCHACKVCNGQLGSRPVSLPPFLVRLTIMMHAFMHVLFPRASMIHSFAGGLKTSAPPLHACISCLQQLCVRRMF